VRFFGRGVHPELDPSVAPMQSGLSQDDKGEGLLQNDINEGLPQNDKGLLFLIHFLNFALSFCLFIFNFYILPEPTLKSHTTIFFKPNVLH
jgi:hypothetical protein